MHLQLLRLPDIDRREIVALNTHPDVLRQMPLARSLFDDAACREWVAGKEQQWAVHGYGPWAFVIDGAFAGWGGLQHENGDADLALVLHPRHWGAGRRIFEEIVRRAFGEMALPSITILLPPTRTRLRAVFRLGFRADGELLLDGQRFLRYRLKAPRALTGTTR